MPGRRPGWCSLAVVWAVVMWLYGGAPSRAQDGGATEPAQSVLGPGLYVFQTRTRDATCGDSERDGYVLSYFAAVHGVPHDVNMGMELVNTPHFKQWTLKVVNHETILGSARMGTSAEAPEAQFEVKRAGDRFKGTGYRSYYSTVAGKRQRCRVNYDALLRRLDM